MSFLPAVVIASALCGPPALASCQLLSAELAALDTRGGDRFSTAAVRQRAELARAEGLAARCSLVATAACADMPRRLREMRVNLAGLDAAAGRSRGGAAPAGRRASLMAAMRRQGCDRRSVAAAPAPPTGGLLAFLGFAPRTPAPEIIMRGPAPILPREGPAERALRRRIEAPDAPIEDAPHAFGRGPYRTLCVRSCDGYFWPVSHSVPSVAFERDEAICRAACPNLEVSLYVHRNPGGTSAQAVSLFGQPYSELPNANRFRDRFDAACQCRPAAPDASPDSMRAGFTPVPPQVQALPPRSTVLPLVISTNRDHDTTSDRETGSEGLRGVHPGRSGPLMPDAPEDAPPPASDRSAAEGP